MTDKKTRSSWWYIQIVLAVIATGVLAVFFYNMISAATSDIEIIKIVNVSG